MFAFLVIFSVFQQKSGFGVFLVNPPRASVLLSASVKRCFVFFLRGCVIFFCPERMHDFFFVIRGCLIYLSQEVAGFLFVSKGCMIFFVFQKVV